MDFVAHNWSTKGQKGAMKVGDLVILYERHDSMSYIFLKKNDHFNNRHGCFRHNDMIGKPFGCMVHTTTGDGFVYALTPTPELWTFAVMCRTQIVDEIDCSFVVLHLDLFPGCHVVDSGTGSGCMGTVMARSVAPMGKVSSFEYNKIRSELAQKEFDRNGVGGIVSCTWCNVCEDGFVGLDKNSVDAVFLDLPDPWRAIPHAFAVLKPGRKVCTYSPCIEQVTRTCEALRASGFHSIRMVEVRLRPSQAKVVALDEPDMGTDYTFEEAFRTDVLRNVLPREERPGWGSGDFVDKEKGEGEGEGEGRPAKAARLAERSSEEPRPHEDHDKINALSPPPRTLPGSPQLVNLPSYSAKGHTAFLTFAVRPLSAPTPTPTPNPVGAAASVSGNAL